MDIDPVELDGTTHASSIGKSTRRDAPHQQAPGAVESTEYRIAMRRLAAGVVVVIALVEGRPWGLTVNSCVSVTTDPPELLVSLGRQTRSRKALRARRRFGVSILSAGQEEVARRGSAPGEPRFLDDLCTDVPGLSRQDPPMVRDALCHLACRVTRVYDHPTHDIFIGRVSRVVGTDRELQEPLIYFNGGFLSSSKGPRRPR